MTKSTSIIFNITFLGAGGVACSLAPALKKAGCVISQVYSRTKKSAEALASVVGAEPVTKLDLIRNGADFYIYCLKDDALDSVLSHKLPFSSGMHIHTSGSIPINVFKKHFQSYGCLYPFQTFSRSRVVDLSTTPFFLEANDSISTAKIQILANAISDQIYSLSSKNRPYLHVAGVLANNFTNALFIIAEDLLKRAKLPVNVIEPIIEETVAKAMAIGPKAAQTGPAQRGDTGVIDTHLELLKGDPEYQAVYRMLTDFILKETYSQK